MKKVKIGKSAKKLHNRKVIKLSLEKTYKAQR